MRTILLLGVVVGILAVTGIVSFSRNSEGDMTLTFDKQRAKEVAGEVIEKGREIEQSVQRDLQEEKR